MKFKGRGKSAPIAQLTDVMDRGYFQQVRFFIDLGIDIDSSDGAQRTPLMLCALMEPEEWGTGIARLLIEKGAALDSVDRYGMNAMHLACIYGRVELARILLNALDFDLTEADKWGNTVLHYAVRAGSVPLVRLVVHAHKKYKIPMDRKNRDGLSALEEAHRFSHGRCAEIIAAADRIPEADVELLVPPPTLDLRFSKETLSGVRSPSERSMTRPRTAFVTRRDSLSSGSSTSSLYLAQRPIFVREFAGAKREKLPNEKDFNQIIRCASLSDFRNNPEYLYNLTVPGAIVSNGSHAGNRQTNRPKSCYARRPVSVSSEGPGFSWRVEFKRLYVHYEYQCSPSYRDAAKYVPGELPSLDGSGSPLPHEDGEDGERGKKGKRCGSGKKDAAEKQRKQSQQQKQRKQSNVQTAPDKGKQSSTSLDGSLGSSSESIGSSGLSSKKQQATSGDTQPAKPTKSATESHGRMSRTTHYGKTVPHVAVHEDDGNSADGRSSKTPPIDQNKLKP